MSLLECFVTYPLLLIFRYCFGRFEMFQVLRYIPYKAEITAVNYANFSTYALHFEL